MAALPHLSRCNAAARPLFHVEPPQQGTIDLDQDNAFARPDKTRPRKAGVPGIPEWAAQINTMLAGEGAQRHASWLQRLPVLGMVPFICVGICLPMAFQKIPIER